MKNSIFKRLGAVLLASVFTVSAWAASSVTPQSSAILKKDLISTDSGKGAALIGAKATGTNAKARNVQHVLLDEVRVTDYMTSAQIEDIRNNTAALDVSAPIQDAINYAATLGRGAKVKFISGRYKIGTGLTVTNNNIRLIGEGMFNTLIVTTTNITPLTIGTNPITGITGADVLDIGFYHTNAVEKTTPQIVLKSPIQSKYRVWMQNGKYGMLVYGGQGLDIQAYSPGNYDIATDAKLNSAEGIVFRAASTLAGHTLGAGAVDLPTNVTLRDLYINGPRLKGWQYGVAIYAGEHITFTGDYYIGQSTINNVHIEQDANNKLILEVKLEKGGYIDASGNQAIYIGGASGNGSQYIGSISIACDIKGQTGDGLQGIYIDGTSRGGSFSQAVRNVLISSNVSGFLNHGINISGGININVSGANAWGNSYAAINQGYGLLFGANVTGATVSGGKFGGGTFGDGTGNQTAGIGIDAGAKNVTINGADVRGNQSAIAYTQNAATSGNRITNVAGFNENRAGVTPAIPASTVDFFNPYGSPASVLIFGGTVTAIKLNGVQMFSNTVNVPIWVGAGDRISITYSVAPSWVWWPH